MTSLALIIFALVVVAIVAVFVLNKILDIYFKKDKNSTQPVKSLTKKLIKPKILIPLILVITIIGTLITVDYSNYYNYKPSRFFGSKDIYEQPQSLFFDGIKVTVTEVEQIDDTKSEEDCRKDHKGSERFDEETQAILNEAFMDCLARAAIPKKTIKVHYFIENLTEENIDLSEFTFKLAGPGEIYNNKPWREQKELLGRQSEYNALVVSVSENNYGPFSLLVSKDNKQKHVKLVLGKLEVSDFRY